MSRSSPVAASSRRPWDRTGPRRTAASPFASTASASVGRSPRPPWTARRARSLPAQRARPDPAGDLGDALGADTGGGARSGPTAGDPGDGGPAAVGDPDAAVAGRDQARPSSSVAEGRRPTRRGRAEHPPAGWSTPQVGPVPRQPPGSLPPGSSRTVVSTSPLAGSIRTTVPSPMTLTQAPSGVDDAHSGARRPRRGSPSPGSTVPASGCTSQAPVDIGDTHRTVVQLGHPRRSGGRRNRNRTASSSEPPQAAEVGRHGGRAVQGPFMPQCAGRRARRAVVGESPRGPWAAGPGRPRSSAAEVLQPGRHVLRPPRRPGRSGRGWRGHDLHGRQVSGVLQRRRTASKVDGDAGRRHRRGGGGRVRRGAGPPARPGSPRPAVGSSSGRCRAARWPSRGSG